MSGPKCLRCGALQDGPEPDRPGRCAWCGALLAGEAGTGRPLVARPRLTPQKARAATALALARTGRTWLPGSPQLVFYPFAPTHSPRKPYLALAQLPPLLRRGWTPTGADLLTWSGAASAGIQLEGAVRVPVSLPLSTELPVVDYPFYRVPLAQEGRDSAAWCDASSGQVILPDDLVAEQRSGSSGFVRITAGLFAVGGVVGLVVPFGVSVVLAGIAAGAAWWVFGRR
jgi:hypothetical protein